MVRVCITDASGLLYTYSFASEGDFGASLQLGEINRACGRSYNVLQYNVCT